MCYSGLVLESLGDGSAKYKRIGAFFNQCRDWMMGAGEETKKTVVIV